MKKLIFSTLMAATIMTASAQHTILGTTPAHQGELPTMGQMTPGHPDYVYTLNLLNTQFDDNGKFTFYTPDNASKAPARKRVRGTVSADGLWTALNEGDRLWVETVGEGQKQRLEVSLPDAPSNNPIAGQSEVVWGQSVHRNEFGINKGIFWSPSGHQLAFYCMNQSMVGQYPLLQTDAREAEVKWVRYPMIGMTSHQVVLGIYRPEEKSTLWIKTGAELVNAKQQPATGTRHHQLVSDPEHYLTCVTWRPDGKQIFIAELNRKQNYMELNAYDAETGEYIETLFTEESAKYVEPEDPMTFLPDSNDKFIWMSERDGYKHMYLYDLKATRTAEGISAEKQLTHGDWMINELIGIDENCKYAYFMATKESPLENHLYSLDMKSLKVSLITTTPGRHSVIFNKNYTQVYDTFTSHDTPRQCQLIDLKKGRAEQTAVIYKAPDPYVEKNIARPEVEVGTLKAADGKTDLYYRLVKPLNYNDGKKHPVVVYLYNGPHAQMVTDGYQWGLPGWDAYMATRGYVVFTIDGRGSDKRGLAFEQTIWHNLGYNEGQDQMKGVEYLKTLPYIDADRMGIYGWSYGGFMATYMTLNYPETFKVGVAGGAVLDWSRYEIMYGERYMGTPEDNPEGFAANTMINQTAKLKGHLLLIHDDQDDTVVPQMSMQFLKNAVATDTYPDYLLYMNHPHNVRGKDRVHLLNNITRYFDKNL